MMIGPMIPRGTPRSCRVVAAGCVLAVMLALGAIAGCDGGESSTEQLRQEMLDYLAATYGEEFVAGELTMNSYYYGSDILTVSEADDSSVVFNVYRDADNTIAEGPGGLRDDYPLGKWNAELTSRMQPVVAELMGDDTYFGAYIEMAPTDVMPHMTHLSLDEQLVSGDDMSVLLVLACPGNGDRLSNDPTPFYSVLEELRSLGPSRYVLSVGFLDDPGAVSSQLVGTRPPDWVNLSVEKNAYFIVDSSDGITGAEQLPAELRRSGE